MKKIKKRIKESKQVSALVNLAKRIRISKRDENVTLYDAIYFTRKELELNDVLTESKAVAFSFTLAVFPGMIFLFTLIPFVNSYFQFEWLTEESIIQYLENILHLKGEFSDALFGMLYDMAHKPNTGLLSIGFALALIMSTNGMVAMMDSFTKMYKTQDQRNFIVKRLIALALTFLLVVVLVSAVMILVFGPKIINFLHDHFLLPDVAHDLIATLRLVEYSVFFLIFFFAISFIYYWGPAMHKRWRFFSHGAIVASILCVSISAIFSYYINNHSNYNKLYGSIGTLIGFMIWLQIISQMMLIGFEINAGIDAAKRSKRREVSGNL
jgi:membrane protein